ncbi:peptide deformylase [Candidatus Gottesmanbacteria bacterium]|nr:peptide deformylase [Candidatus Gottesmanbacteria bacterium]
MLSIVTVPNDILNHPTKVISHVDAKILKIATEMKEKLAKMTDPKGVGLAANQVGINLSLFVFRQGPKIRTLINPKIISRSNDLIYDKRGKNTMLEGCLSIPHYYGLVKRPSKIRLSFLDLENVTHEEEFKSADSIIIQHEIDHLQGKLFITRLLEQKGKLYKIDLNSKDKDLAEVEI